MCAAPCAVFAPASVCWSRSPLALRPTTCFASRWTTCPGLVSRSTRSSARSGASSSGSGRTSPRRRHKRDSAIVSVACAFGAFGAARFGRKAAFGVVAGLRGPAAQPAFAFFDLREQERAGCVREAVLGAVTDHDAVALVEHECGRVIERLAVEIEVQVIAAVSGEPADLGGTELHTPELEEVAERELERAGSLHVEGS